ncbi:MAG: zinc metalloprotease HtpX [Planctomycetota bacterium]|nr:zinc metalloprotease HtpX [Planctomycetota bacterium]
MIRTALLLTALTMFLVFIGNLVGGQTGMIIALVIGLALNFVNYWFSSTLILKAFGGKELKRGDHGGQLDWLYDDIEQMAQRADMPMPRVAVIPKPGPNAFATGRNPKNAVVAVTQGLLHVCDRRQVRAVMAHELGHVKNRDMLTMTLVSGAVSAIGMLAWMAQWGAIFGGGDEENGGFLGLLAVAIFAPLVAGLVQMGISRAREYEADAAGARISGDPHALADALETLHRNIPRAAPVTETGTTAHLMIANPFAGRSLANLFSTHPDPKERIRRLRAMA